MVLKQKENSDNLNVKEEKGEMEQLYQELLEITAQYNSEPKGLNFDYKVEYAKQKINYFRSKGLSDELLYPLEANVSIYLTQYVVDNLIEWYDLLGHRIDSFIMALKKLIDEKEFEKAKKLAEALITFFAVIDESELQNKIAISDDLGLKIYCRIKGVNGAEKDLFMKNDYAIIWVLYAHILKNTKIMGNDKERFLTIEAETYLKRAIRMNPIRAEAWIEIFPIYTNEPNKYRNTLRQAFLYVYLPNGFGSLASIYETLAIDTIRQKGSINLIIALQKAVQAFEGKTEKIDCLVGRLKETGVWEENLENNWKDRDYEEVLYQYGIPVGFSCLVKCMAEEISKSNESERWKYLWEPIIFDELVHGINNFYQISLEEKEKREKVKRAVRENWTNALKIALNSYIVDNFRGATRRLEVPGNIKTEFVAFVKRYKIVSEKKFSIIYDDCEKAVVENTAVLKIMLLCVVVVVFFIQYMPIIGFAIFSIGLIMIYKKWRIRRIWNERGDALGSVVKALEEMCVELGKIV